ncbi:hypothetical protein O181_015525 [Austropuccinia psidii MF-1]|uniref:Uncharacterized protein n=1 Tax=Austropuccinia psidii MF-1 TaxID=1389203 RepID=A0A9Q3GR15_9BASI|nr:hypothetical protein [Austropuccinia psidii MF-1]
MDISTEISLAEFPAIVTEISQVPESEEVERIFVLLSSNGSPASGSGMIPETPDMDSTGRSAGREREDEGVEDEEYKGQKASPSLKVQF